VLKSLDNAFILRCVYFVWIRHFLKKSDSVNLGLVLNSVLHLFGSITFNLDSNTNFNLNPFGIKDEIYEHTNTHHPTFIWRMFYNECKQESFWLNDESTSPCIFQLNVHFRQWQFPMAKLKTPFKIGVLQHHASTLKCSKWHFQLRYLRDPKWPCNFLCSLNLLLVLLQLLLLLLSPIIIII
jgi:hypothetical protein